MATPNIVTSFFGGLGQSSQVSAQGGDVVQNFFSQLPTSTPTPTPRAIPTVQAPQGGFKIGDVLSNITTGVTQAVKTVESTFTKLSNGLQVALTKPTIISPIPTQTKTPLPTVTDFQTGQKQLTPTQMTQLQPSLSTPTAGTSAQLTPATQKKAQNVEDTINQFVTTQLSNVGKAETSAEKNVPAYGSLEAGVRSTVSSFIANVNPQFAKKYNSLSQPQQSTIGSKIIQFIGQQIPYIPLAIVTDAILNPITTKLASLVPEGTSVATNILSRMAQGAIKAAPVVGVLSGLPATKTPGERAKNVAVGTLAGGIFGGVAAGAQTIASELLAKFGTESESFLANWDTVTKVLNATDKTQYTAEENAQIKLLNQVGLTREALKNPISVTVESPAKGPVWDFLRSIFNGQYVPKPTTEAPNAPDNLLTPGEHTPEEVINTVISSDLKNTPDGKTLMQAATQAQKSGQNITISEPPKPSTGGEIGGGSNTPITNSIQTIKAIVTPDDKVINPIIEEVSGIIQEHENNQSNSNTQNPNLPQTSTGQTQVAGGQTGKVIQESNNQSIGKGQNTENTNNNKGIGVNNGGKLTTTQSPTTNPTSSWQGLKTSKIAKEIEAKAVENRLTTGFSKLAGYSPINIKEQSAKATTLVNSDLETARGIVRGEIPLPEGLKGTALITAMEEHLVKNPDAQIALELAKSPLVSGTSQAAQELRLAGERDPYSPLELIKKLEDNTKAVIEKKTGESISKTTEKEVKSIKAKIAKEVPKVDAWLDFIKSVECGS